MRLHFVCRPWSPGCGASSMQRFFEIYRQQGHDVHLSISKANNPGMSYRVDRTQFTEILHEVHDSRPDWIVVTTRSDIELVKFLYRRGCANVVVHDSDEIIHPAHAASLDGLQDSAAMLLQEHKSIADSRAKSYRYGAHWLPPSFNRYLEPTIANKKYDIGFLGYVNRYRHRVLSIALPQISPNWVVHNPSTHGLLLGEEVGNFYASCRIVVGLPRLADQHYATSDRLWQVLGSGSMYLMSGLKEPANVPFVDGKHLVMFNSAQDLIRKARYYLWDDPQQLGKIAKAGQCAVYKQHLDVHRAEEFWSLMENLRGAKSENPVHLVR